MRNTLVVVNPAAGAGRAGRVWTRLLAARPELARAAVVRAGDPETARRELAERLAGGVERLLAVGGDGTAHLAAGALLAAERRGELAAADVALGLVPAGTGSDLARSLELPRRPEAALERVLAAAPRPFDALEIETGGERRHAVNIASAGLSGVVASAVNRSPRRGRSSYLAATLAGLWRYRPVPCRVEADGEEVYDGGFFLVAVANARYFGNGMPVAPAARFDDGLIDLVVIPPVPRWQLPYRLPQFLRGTHLRLPIVRYRRARHVRLEPRPGFPPFEVDGETLLAGPADVRVLPGALRILA